MLPVGDLYITKDTDFIGSLFHYSRYMNGQIFYFIVSNENDIFMVMHFKKNTQNELVGTYISLSTEDKAFIKMIPYEGRFGYELKDFDKIRNISDARIVNELNSLMKILSFYGEIFEAGVAEKLYIIGHNYKCNLSN